MKLTVLNGALETTSSDFGSTSRRTSSRTFSRSPIFLSRSVTTPSKGARIRLYALRSVHSQVELLQSFDRFRDSQDRNGLIILTFRGQISVRQLLETFQFRLQKRDPWPAPVRRALRLHLANLEGEVFQSSDRLPLLDVVPTSAIQTRFALSSAASLASCRLTTVPGTSTDGASISIVPDPLRLFVHGPILRA